MPPAIAQAVKEVEAFPGIVTVGEPIPIDGAWVVKAWFLVSMPSRAAEKGISSTGVKSVEVVSFVFPGNYPRRAPKPFLRKDFPRNLPHINAGSESSPVSPCIYEGLLDDLLHRGLGLTEILSQMQDWLEKAASNSLINRNQGWEPIRFDTVPDSITYDRYKLQSFIGSAGGSHFVVTSVVRWDGGAVFSVINYEPRQITQRFRDLIAMADSKEDIFTSGCRPMLLCWADESMEVDMYFPETVTTLGELIEKSKVYGTYKQFWEQIQLLRNMIPKGVRTVEVVTTHCVRRPLILIGQDTSFEFLSYLVRVEYTDIGGIDMGSPVDILRHRHEVGPEMLRRISGASVGKMESIIQVGCGSLGSKIAMHLCRAGHGPFSLIDPSRMTGHNLARHALTSGVGNKAVHLKKEMDNFHVKATAHPHSLLEYLEKSSARLFEKESLIIDSTASLSVRETLASLPAPTNNSRIFQTGLYSNAKMGFITIEGRGRNPRVDDLSAAIFDAAIDDKPLSDVLSVADAAFQRQATGQGCGSFTTIIPDTKISLHAAAMAERARQVFEGDIPEEGEISLGFLDSTGMSLRWQGFGLGKTRRVPQARTDWELRVLAPALKMMEDEVAKWPGVETGGILIGKLSLARKCAIVTRILEAPPDSLRSAATFELGTDGLAEKISAIHKASNLTYLGTWHSHLCGGRPSGTDESTLRKIKELKLGIPAFNLIWYGGELTCFADYGDY